MDFIAFYGKRDSFHFRQAGIEEHLIRFTEIIPAVCSSRLFPVSAASASAQEKVSAGSACAGRGFETAEETALFLPLLNDSKIIRYKISEFIFIQSIKIAWIDTPVCFYDILEAADASLVTGFRFKAKQDADIIFKLTDIRLAAVFQVDAP